MASRHFLLNFCLLFILFACAKPPKTPTPTATTLPTTIAIVGNQPALASLATTVTTPSLVTPSRRLTITQHEPPQSVDPEPTPTIKPTATAKIPDSLAIVVNTIVSNLNSHQREGYPLTDNFFHGVFGTQTQINTEYFFSASALLLYYAGDIYGMRDLIISANPDTPLPANLTYAQALALNPTEHIVSAIVYSDGWGNAQTGEALFYFTQQAGEQKWMGAIFSFDHFATVPEYALVAPPDELSSYLAEQAAVIALKERLTQQFHAAPFQISINPSLSTAVIADGSHQYGVYKHTVIDIASGNSTSYQGEIGNAISVTNSWLDDQRLLIKYHNINDDYPSPGHIAILDVTTNELTLLDETTYIYDQLSVTERGAIVYPKGEHVVIWQDGVLKLIDVKPILDRGGNKQGLITSSTISADQRYVIAVTRFSDALGYVLLDTETDKTTVISLFNGPPMEGSPNLALWNTAGTWATLSPWTFLADQQGLILVEAATGELHHLGISSSDAHWLNDALLLFYATINNEQQTFLYDVRSGEQVQVKMQVEEGHVGDSAEPPTQDVIFPTLNLHLKIPVDWQAAFYANSAYLYSNLHPFEYSNNYRYTVWTEEIPNPNNLPLADAYYTYANTDNPELLAKISSALSIVYFPKGKAVHSDFIFSFSIDGALGYFFKHNNGYILLALGPYDADEPLIGQSEIITEFEAIAASVDSYYLRSEDSAEPCDPIAADHEAAISFTLQPQPYPCVTWRDDSTAQAYRVTLAYMFDHTTDDIDYVHYLVAGDVHEVAILPADSPCYTQYGELIRNGSVMIDVVALTQTGEKLVDSMAINMPCPPTKQP